MAADEAPSGAGTAPIESSRVGAQADAHARPAESVLAALDVDPARGLTAEAAARRLVDAGPNVIARAPGASRLAIVVHQFEDPLVLLLVAAAAVSAAIGEAIDAAVIAAILVVNAVLGFVQESGAERAILALRDAVAPSAMVIRHGQRQAIASEELVPGDVIVVEEGDRVPADARLLSALGLSVNESLLTGEPVPVEKGVGQVAIDAPLAERLSMVYAGTAVTRGHAHALVTGTGWSTEVGRIALLAGGARAPETPLQRRLGGLSRRLVVAGLAITAVLAGAMLVRGAPPHEAFLIGVSVAVAAVPEGLAATITIALADGARRMARRRAIVRHLEAVETVGSATVIAADKTGTLTLNQLRVAAVHPTAGCTSEDVLRAGALATITADLGDGQGGDPVDAAFLRAAAAASPSARRPDRLLVVPFDPERRRVTAAYRDGSGARVVVKGAPEVLAARSVQPQSEVDAVLEANRAYAALGYRVLAVGEAELGELPQHEPERIDERLELRGLVALEDPLRADAAESVHRALTAGIRVVMLTGDQAPTAAAIAQQLGIADCEPVTGPELAEIPDAALASVLRRKSVFARVTPAEKLRLVTAFQDAGDVVVVTGDGVNDTPALRRADVGVAMGLGGTEAAREAADIVLTDDAFSTIVAAVEEGRRIAQNMRAFVSYLLSANAGEVLLFTAAILLAGAPPMTVVQVLTINLLTDGLPALALTRDPLAPETMHRPPEGGQTIVSAGAATLLALVAVAVAAVAGTAYAIGSTDATEPARTMAYATLSLAEIVVVFSLRSTTLAAWRGPRNVELVVAVAASAALLAASVYLPLGNEIFNTVPLSILQTTAVAALSVVPLLLAELWKRGAHVPA